MTNALSVTHPDVHVFFWCDENWVWRLQTLYRELGIKQQRLCWWLKGNWSMTPQVAFNKAAECCIYGVQGSPHLSEAVTNLHEVLNKEVGVGNRMIEPLEYCDCDQHSKFRHDRHVANVRLQKKWIDIASRIGDVQAVAI